MAPLMARRSSVLRFIAKMKISAVALKGAPM